MMKSVIKSLSILSSIAYVGGIIVTAIYLYNLPENLITNSTVLDLRNIQEINPVINQSFIIIAVVLGFGLTAQVLQVISSVGNGQAKIVYVEKFKDEDQSSKITENEDGEKFDTSSLSQEIIAKIQQTSVETKDPDKVLEHALRIICNQLEASQGAVYVCREEKKRRFIELRASFAYMKAESEKLRYEYGEGLPGQVAKEGIIANLNSVPDGYIKILSGLGQATPKHLLLIPIKEKEKVVGVIEIASFTAFSVQDQEISAQAFTLLGKYFSKASEKIDVTAEVFHQVEEDSQNI